MIYTMPAEVRTDIETLASIWAAAPADIKAVLAHVAAIPLPMSDAIRTAMPREVIEAARRCVG